MMTRRRRGGFTLLELMAVIAIICVLAGIMMAGAGKAREIAKRRRTEAILDVLATACERYWTLYHDYPYPNPDSVGLGGDAAFRSEYYSGGWSTEGYNVTLVWMLSQPRQPEPLIALQERWYEKTEKDLKGPDGRNLYRVVDGFGNVIKVDRPIQYYYVNTYVKLVSSGPDGDFDETEDNLERYIKR
ncbi:MAG TPA: type II secretion system protein [Planctomycetota bacterium]|nr:type II secretion system protein [Planctomycetota bacterium]